MRDTQLILKYQYSSQGIESVCSGRNTKELEALAELFLFLIVMLSLTKVKPEGKQTKPAQPDMYCHVELADEYFHGPKSPTYSTAFHLMTCVTTVLRM